MTKNQKILLENGESTAKEGVILIERDLLTGVYFCHYNLTKPKVTKLLKLVIKNLKPKQRKHQPLTKNL